MTTLPSRLARAAASSLDHAHARHRVLQLYRDWHRAAPEICALYALTVAPSQVRGAIRDQFEQHRHVQDLKVIDVLLLKGLQEYQETMNCWKQEPHIMGILLAPKARPRQTFIQKFLAGLDEEAIIPQPSQSPI